MARSRRCSTVAAVRTPQLVDDADAPKLRLAVLDAARRRLACGAPRRVAPSPPPRRRRAARPVSRADTADTEDDNGESDHSTPQATALARHSHRRAPMNLREHARTPQAPAKLATIAMNATGAATEQAPPPEPIKSHPSPCKHSHHPAIAPIAILRSPSSPLSPDYRRRAPTTATPFRTPPI